MVARSWSRAWSGSRRDPLTTNSILRVIFFRADFAFVSVYEQSCCEAVALVALIELLEREVDSRGGSSYERVGPVGFLRDPRCNTWNVPASSQCSGRFPVLRKSDGSQSVAPCHDSRES